MRMRFERRREFRWPSVKVMSSFLQLVQCCMIRPLRGLHQDLMHGSRGSSMESILASRMRHIARGHAVNEREDQAFATAHIRGEHAEGEHPACDGGERPKEVTNFRLCAFDREGTVQTTTKVMSPGKRPLQLSRERTPVLGQSI